jgi:hypothetical protein
VRSAAARETQDRFLGVRLTTEELRLLDAYAAREQSRNRSDAVRSLVRSTGAPSHDAVAIPLQVRAELETMVEDGWAPNVEAALVAVLTPGLEAFARAHSETLDRLRAKARENADRRERRRQAEREGQGRLER